MNDQTREHLSSLMDGEVSRETSRFLVRRLGADVELQQTWSRWHVVRDCMRYPESTMASDDLRDRIASAIEDSHPAAATTRRPGWLKPVSGFAVAASVALAAVLTVSNGGPGGIGQELDSAAAAEPFTSPQGLARPAATRQVSVASSADDDRMNAYVLRHYQATGSAGSPNFVTFVPILVTGSATAQADAEEAEPEVSQATPDPE